MKHIMTTRGEKRGKTNWQYEERGKEIQCYCYGKWCLTLSKKENSRKTPCLPTEAKDWSLVQEYFIFFCNKIKKSMNNVTDIVDFRLMLLFWGSRTYIDIGTLPETLTLKWDLPWAVGTYAAVGWAWASFCSALLLCPLLLAFSASLC